MEYGTRTAGVIASGLLAVALVVNGAIESRAAPIKLTMVGAWPPKVSSAADIGIKFKDTVNKADLGKLIIEFKGSRDVCPDIRSARGLGPRRVRRMVWRAELLAIIPLTYVY